MTGNLLQWTAVLLELTPNVASILYTHCYVTFEHSVFVCPFSANYETWPVGNRKRQPFSPCLAFYPKMWKSISLFHSRAELGLYKYRMQLNDPTPKIWLLSNAWKFLRQILYAGLPGFCPLMCCCHECWYCEVTHTLHALIIMFVSPVSTPLETRRSHVYFAVSTMKSRQWLQFA